MIIQGGKDDKKDDKKGGKKKKELEVELKRMFFIYIILVTWYILLVDFLEGEYEFRFVFIQGGVEVVLIIKSLDIGKVKDFILIFNWYYIFRFFFLFYKICENGKNVYYF